MRDVQKGHWRQKDEKTDSGGYLQFLCSECFVFPSGVYENSTRSRASLQYRRYWTRTCYGPSLCMVSVGLPLTEFHNGASMHIVVVACTSFGYQTKPHLRRYPITHDIYKSIHQSTRLITYPPINQAIKIPIYLSTHPFICLPPYQPIKLFTHPRTYLSNHPFIYLYLI